jgi:hypothetical protein
MYSGDPQTGKIMVQNLVERRGRAFAAFEQSHPPSIAKQNVIQQSMNASERPRTPLPVLGIVQLRTFRKKALVRDAIVSRQHLKMSRQVHSSELTSESQSASPRDRS